MQILYFHQHFSTPHGATGTRSYEMARGLIARGHQVTMVCGTGSRSGLDGGEETAKKGVRRYQVDGIQVVELCLPYSNHDSFAKRSITFLRYAFKSVAIACRTDYDLLFATSTPLTAGIPGIVMRLFKPGRPFVFEVRDLWPELPREMGVIRNPLALGAMSVLEWLSYNCARACIGLSPGIVTGIKRRLRKEKPVAMIPNGCDLDLFGTTGRQDDRTRGPQDDRTTGRWEDGTTNNKQPITGQEERDHGRWTTDYGLTPSANIESLNPESLNIEVNKNEEPRTKNQAPGGQKSEVRGQTPETKNQQPAKDNEELRTKNEGTANQEPDNAPQASQAAGQANYADLRLPRETWGPSGVFHRGPQTSDHRSKSPGLRAVFTGAHGIANGLDAVLDAAGVLKKRDRDDIELAFIGDGKLKPRLVERAEIENLDNCKFIDPIPKLELATKMFEFDVGLMVLDNVPAFYYGTSPNKFFDYIASGLPVVNNYPGWLADIIGEYDCGIAVPPQDAEAFADALECLADDPEDRIRMGQNARKLAEERFSRRQLASQFAEFLEERV